VTVAQISAALSNANNWDTAYGWGYHGDAGYATTSQLHNALTLGTNQNGLSLTGQTLSLGLASGSATGALSSTHWTAFNNKIGGTIATGQVAFGTAAGVIGGDSGLFWDNTTKILSVQQLRVVNTTLSVPSNPFIVEDIIDPNNNAVSATRIYPLTNNKRLFLGATGSQFFSLDLTGIGSSGIRNSPLIEFRGGANVGIRFSSGDSIYGQSGDRMSISSFSGTEFRSNTGTLRARIGHQQGTSSNLLSIFYGDFLIGKTTYEGFRLDVNGTARIVGATRIDNLAGTGTRMVVADANGVMSTQALGIAGSGTLNRLAKFTAAGTVGDSQVFDNGTNVGIGTDSPAFHLDVRGTTLQTLRLSRTGIAGSGGEAGIVFEAREPNIGTGQTTRISSGAGFLVFNTGGVSGDVLGGTERMRITSGGNVGIGTTTDAGFRLDVNGTARATAFFTSSDKRKKDIISQDGDLAIYRFKGDKQIHYGYIAQEMRALYPHQVSKGTDGMLSLNYVEILVKKVHDLESKLKRHGLD
jgi:hypothetical protein